MPSLESTGIGRGSIKSYTAGYLISLFLSAGPFILVMFKLVPRQLTVIAIVSAAVIQMLVHLHFFLRLNTSGKARWNVVAFMLAMLIIILFMGGTVWIMHNLNYDLS